MLESAADEPAQDLSATPMRHCFQAKPDLTPYVRLPSAAIELDEMNPPLKKLTGQALFWAKKSLELNLDEEDQADEDIFNRILWHATHGAAPYPAAFVGRRRSPKPAAPGRNGRLSFVGTRTNPFAIGVALPSNYRENPFAIGRKALFTVVPSGLSATFTAAC